MDTYQVAALACIFFFDCRELLAVWLLISIILSRATLACISRELLIIITLVVLAIRLYYKLLISYFARWFKWFIFGFSLHTATSIWKGNCSLMFLLRVRWEVGLHRISLHNYRLVIWLTSRNDCDGIVDAALSRNLTDPRCVIVITWSSGVDKLLQERDLLLWLKILVEDWRVCLINSLI